MADLAAKVALRALHYGAPHIPDRIFESIPGGYFKPPEKKQERRSGKGSRKEGRSGGYNSDHHTSGDEGRHRQSKRSDRSDNQRRRAKSLNSEKRDRYADESGRTAGFGTENMDYQQPARGYDPYLPKPYNPQDYADPAGVAAAAAAGAAAAQAPTGNYHQSPNPYDQYYDYERRPSSAEMKYRPTNYSPSAQTPYPYARPAYTPPNQAGYTPPPSATTSPTNPYAYHATPHNHVAYAQPMVYPIPAPVHHRASHSPPRSPSRSRRKKATSYLRAASLPRSLGAVQNRLSNLDDGERRMAASAVGAVAGGFLAHEIVGSDIGTAVGAAIGGLAMRGWEKMQEDKNDARKDDKSSGDRSSKSKHSHHSDRNSSRRGRHHRRRRSYQDYSDDGYDSF